MKSKQDLIDQIHANSAISKSVIAQITQQFCEAIRAELLAGGSVHINELGTFKLAVRKAHTGHNPYTGESIHVPEKRVPQLKFVQSISRALNSE